ncbi:PREDICTED: putative F-box protein At4g05475 [Camelina sativa]|uniref:F-box protein At4g05475 n=1 Tax=Camelina sativa TaxID=90675 RepID=A0ABM0TD95_CAMSA|nr:PREDICTED: putative F-box protein At4g05475 [Camelina sativa]
MSASFPVSLATSVPPVTKEVKEEPINLAELPSDLTASILIRLGAVDILENAKKVCTSWRDICKDPSMWRKIDLRAICKDPSLLDDFAFDRFCRHGVDLSQGSLLEIDIEHFATDSLLTYIAERSSNLRSLGLRVYHGFVTNKGLVDAIAKFPLLETLEVSHSSLKLNLKAIGQACPQLKTLKLNSSGSVRVKCDDEYALAIAESMPQLCHLQLLGDRLTDTGLNAILDGCPNLEHLDLRKCFNIKLAGNLEKKCLERIKEFRRPNDPTADYPFDIVFINYDSDEDYSDDEGLIDAYYDFAGTY